MSQSKRIILHFNSYQQSRKIIVTLKIIILVLTIVYTGLCKVESLKVTQLWNLTFTAQGRKSVEMAAPSNAQIINWRTQKSRISKHEQTLWAEIYRFDLVTYDVISSIVTLKKAAARASSISLNRAKHGKENGIRDHTLSRLWRSFREAYLVLLHLWHHF